jgi:hypothetical protein
MAWVVYDCTITRCLRYPFVWWLPLPMLPGKELISTQDMLELSHGVWHCGLVMVEHGVSVGILLVRGREGTRRSLSLPSRPWLVWSR